VDELFPAGAIESSPSSKTGSSQPSGSGVGKTAAAVLLDDRPDVELHYAIPPEMEGKLAAGSRVKVPIQQQSTTGTVILVQDAADAPFKRLKEIDQLIDPKPILTPKLLDLASWVANYYVSSKEAAIRAMLPETVRSNVHRARERKFVELLPDTITPEALATMEKKAKRQWELVRQLQTVGQPLPLADLNASAVKALFVAGYVNVVDQAVERDPYADEEFISTNPLPLNAEQQTCLTAILKAVESPERKPILLYGVTGSGKTEVYLQAAQRVLEMGKDVIVLVPEISLTPQTVDRFKGRFSHMAKQVAVLHSQLSTGERFDEWHKISRGQSRIVIGARSAIYAPLENLGLILVDEEHEGSYKQDQPPRYQGRDVAVVRGKMEGCAVVLGSATPSLESWQNTVTGKYELVQMKERADHCQLPLVRVIDMKLEGKKAKRGGEMVAVISEKLRIAIDDRLLKGEQTILFLNRRGYSKSIVCQSCGFVLQCEQCSVTLRFHKDEAVMVCHICGYRRKAPRKCPTCDDPSIFMAGFGTERVEEFLKKKFPTLRMARVDTDSMSKKNALRDTLAAFKAKKLDLLVGTQMIAKGLHFPNVTLVGILNADLTLHIPDFRSGERTFQLLTQVAGRAGRGEVPGEVIVQTYTPQSPSIQFARHHDFDGYATQELTMREAFGHPPYTRAVLVTVRAEQLDLARLTIETLGEKLKVGLPANIEMSEPMPSPLERSHNQWRFQILFRGPTAGAITRHLMPILRREVRPSREVIATVDVDPADLM
jgi:primosomal protein N' (replication factor Y) (superfamily II helicase)